MEAIKEARKLVSELRMDKENLEADIIQKLIDEQVKLEGWLKYLSGHYSIAYEIYKPEVEKEISDYIKAMEGK